MFKPGDEVLWYHNGERCYGTVAGYADDGQTVPVWTVKEEDADPVREDVLEIYLRDADDPDDPDPNDPTN